MAYIDNEQFTKAIASWVADYKLDKTIPMPEDVAASIMLMVDRFATRPNFSGYTWLDDMKGDALLTCIRYAHNFDINRSNNAFAYFTQIIYHSFAQFLNKEKIQSKVKFNLIKNMNPEIEKIDYNNMFGEE